MVLIPSIVGAQLFFMDNANVANPAPDFTLKNLSGVELNFNEFRDNKRAVIFFWATWCPYCRNELLELSKNKKEHDKNGIKILLVNLGETQEVVNRFVEKNDIPFEVLIDTKSSSNKIYDIVGLPTLFFVNSEGIVTGAKHSFPENYMDILNKKFPG
ncbi:MAG: peroxiredoxin family protein [Candidatus Omnitrophica bacterium]|nr:peroxiredoxin family protein [Candidatus Omnitrophota bacterium]